MKHSIRVLLSLLLIFSLAFSFYATASGAGIDAASEAEEGRDTGGGDSGPASPTPVSGGVTVTPSPSPTPVSGDDEPFSATVLLSDNALQLTANGYQRLRVTTVAAPDQIVWTIDDPNIAQLSSSSGYSITVTAKSAGRTFVHVRAGEGDPETCQITVSGVTLSMTAMEMSAGEVRALDLSRYGEAESVPAAGWEWSSSNTGAALVQKRTDGSLGAAVTAISAGSSVITCTGGGYSAICQLTVSANEANKITASLTNGLLHFSDIFSEMKSTCRSATNGGELSYITNLEVATDQGILYDGYVSEGDTGFGVAGVRRYYNGGVNVYQIENITFMPKAGVTGDVRITYTGYGQNNTMLQQFNGVIIVEVDQSETTLTYASQNLAPVRFRGDDFFAYCMALNNRSLQSVAFHLPSSRYGTLYYNYVDSNVYESLVSAGTRYALTYNPSVNNVSFVPNPDYAGTFSLTFTGYDSEGRSFDGTVRISVNNPGGTDTVDSTDRRLEYTTGPGARVEFRAADFSEECQDRTGYSLSSIQFTSLPASSRGVVYYNRSEEVEEDDVYRRSGSGRSISNLSFVANRNYTGTVSIPFTGTDSRGNTFRAYVTITVNEDGAYPIEYSASAGEHRYFSATDFNDVCQLATGRNLDYVRFTTLPARGTLYYGGSSQVLTSTSYYRTGSGLLLENVSYLAPAGQRGTVSFPYTGTDTSGTSFHGYVWITLSGTTSSSSSSAVSYFTTTGPAVAIRASDILLPAYEEIGDVVSIRLTQPDPEAGRLVTNFISPGRYSAFDSAQEYTPATISQVAFLPKGGFQGTALVQYVARNRQNRVYSSFLRYQVTPPTVSRYFTDLGDRAWAVQAVDFFRNYNILYGVTPTTYEPDGPARRGAFLTVLGRMYGFPEYPGNGGYEDVDTERYYAGSVAAASALGITDPGEYFYPDAAITRADAAVFLYRTLRRVKGSDAISGGTYADVARFTDWYEVPYYAIEAMGALVRLGIFGGDTSGKLNCSSTLTRLQMAAILYRSVM